MGISPWIIVMVILGKGFTYRFMSRINPIYALVYLLAIIAAIPWWRYLGLIE
jgi:hypothetical protein